MTVAVRAAIAVLALGAACSDGGTTEAIDARLVDAPPIDGGPGPLAVVVYPIEPIGPDAGEPLIGAAVYLVGPDGATTIVLTGADGRARAEIAPGTAVFAMRTRANGDAHLAIYTGIDPGVEIVIGAPPATFFDPPLIGEVNLVVFDVPGAVGYRVSSPCSRPDDSGPFFVLGLFPCASREHASIAVWAYGIGSEMLSYGVLRDVDLTAVPPTLAIHADQPAVIATTAFGSVPPEVSGIQVDRTTFDGDLAIFLPSNLLAPDGSTSIIHTPIAPIGDRTLVHTRIEPDGSPATVWNLRREAGDARNVTIDLGASMLPFMTGPAISFAVRTAAWTLVGGSGRRPDIVAIRGSYGNQLRTVELTLVGRGDDTHLTWPPWPADLDPLLPDETSFPFVSEFYAVDVVGRGFDDLVPTVDRDTRGLQFRTDVFLDAADVWITGRSLLL